MTHRTNQHESEGYNTLMNLALEQHDPYDQFAWVQEARFALADATFLYYGVTLPEFRPAPGLNYDDAQDESYLFGSFDDALSHGLADYEDVLRVFAVLTRFRVWIGIAGKDY